ncbi:uncharacterized protein LOC116915752 [Daphnia magna]|uniref:uncharacterized protein LOC116915752 n=1 Tax=Daphnia magna TaxID=35525 RepID=UPI001E1BA827|nr:uncharacterized protein LOC116915752 [Daphnia magna]
MTANINIPSKKHWCFDSFDTSGSQLFLSTPPPHRCLLRRLYHIAVFIYAPSPHRCLHLRCSLRLIAVFIYAVAFASSPSSSTLSPSPHRRLHLRCPLRLIAVFIYAVAFASSLAIFIYAFTSAFASSLSSSHCRLRSIYPKNPWLSYTEKRTKKRCSSADSPRRRKEASVERRSGIVLFCIVVFKLTRWLPPRLRPIFFVACRDWALFCLMVYTMGGTVANAPKGFVPLGAVGNAPVGTSLCRCGDRFLGCAFPKWFLSPCQPGLVFGQVPSWSGILRTRCVVTVV